MKIVSFDIGKKNFAFVVEEINLAQILHLSNIPKNKRYKYNGTATPLFNRLLSEVYRGSKLLLYRNLDLTEDCDASKYLDPQIYQNMNVVLDIYKEYWTECPVILIERQMSFRGKRNTMALKLAQHCYSYFIFHYGNTKKIIEFPAYYKTQILGAPKKLIKSRRKKWAIEKALHILAEREDFNTMSSLNSIKKLDDIADCLLMIVAYTYMVLIDNRKLC